MIHYTMIISTMIHYPMIHSSHDPLASLTPHDPPPGYPPGKPDTCVQDTCKGRQQANRFFSENGSRIALVLVTGMELIHASCSMSCFADTGPGSLEQVYGSRVPGGTSTAS
jgi:hypothetical protein